MPANRRKGKQEVKLPEIRVSSGVLANVQQGLEALREQLLGCTSTLTELESTLKVLRKQEVYYKKDGTNWIAYGPEFINLQESHAGFGRTKKEAAQKYQQCLEEDERARNYVAPEEEDGAGAEDGEWAKDCRVLGPNFPKGAKYDREYAFVKKLPEKVANLVCFGAYGSHGEVYFLHGVDGTLAYLGRSLLQDYPTPYVLLTEIRCRHKAHAKLVAKHDKELFAPTAVLHPDYEANNDSGPGTKELIALVKALPPDLGHRVSHGDFKNEYGFYLNTVFDDDLAWLGEDLFEVAGEDPVALEALIRRRIKDDEALQKSKKKG